MSPKLKPLRLPALVEERRKGESALSESEIDVSPSLYSTIASQSSQTSQFSQTSTPSDTSVPVTPTFSPRSQLRYSTSTSPVDVTMTTPSRDIPSSPTFMSTIKSTKRALPDVLEEPQEPEEEFSMFDENDELYDCFCENGRCASRDPPLIHSSVQLSSKPAFDYDLAGFASEEDPSLSPRSKKRRAGESPFSTLATRIGTRFPSFSRKWRTLQGVSTTSTVMNGGNNDGNTRAESSRSSSMSNSMDHRMEKSLEIQLPPTPTKSAFGSRDDLSPAVPIDIERANRRSSEREQGLATTPLLPPLMVEILTKPVPVQSPLQSPSVADPKDPFCGEPTMRESTSTPQMPGMPSPPLSTKPSISSFHRASPMGPGHLVPSSDIPPMLIADENDEWANKLGHANFTVQPEPYLPIVFDIEACRQLRTDWDLARCNYTKHLVRTGEHYGVTSNTYRLTEEKWRQTDALWKSHNDETIRRTVDNGADAFSTLKSTTFGDFGYSNVMTKIPSLNDPLSGGKFPQLGDTDIVGPMVQVAAQLQRDPSKKAKLMKFFADKFPAGLGRT